MKKEWNELKAWADENTDIHMIKILIESGLSDKEIISELNISEEKYKEIKENLG